MFDIGWTEMLVVAIIMIVIVGPKDLPNMLRTFGRMTAKMRGMAGDFQKQFNDALKEAELDDVKKSVDSLRGLNPMSEIKKQLNPFEKAAADVRSGLDGVMKPKPKANAKASDSKADNATTAPEVSGPDTMPAAPTFPEMTDGSTTKPSVPKQATPKKAATGKTKAAKAGASQTVGKASSTPASASPKKGAAPTKPSTTKAKSGANGNLAGAKPKGQAAAQKLAAPDGAKSAARKTTAKKPATSAKKSAGTAK